MTNLEKMNQLVGDEASKDLIIKWAYMNRILVYDLHFEDEFEEMESSVHNFMSTKFFMENDDEFKLWDKFLDSDYVDNQKN